MREDAKAFSKLVQTGLSLQVNQQAQLGRTLKVGAQTETVEVVSQAPLLESESSSVGTVIGQQMVNQLPLNGRSEEHTSELQSHLNLVCRLLLEKKMPIVHAPGITNPLALDE